jgi:hypothetical protein
MARINPDVMMLDGGQSGGRKRASSPTPPADAATAVRKLQSNQPLTDAEKKLLGISTATAATPTPVPRTTPTPTPTATPKKFTPPELQDIVRRMTAGEKLTAEEAAAVGVSEPSSIKSAPTSTVSTSTSTDGLRVPPTDLNSPEAAEYNEYLKGRAMAGALKPSESEWTKTYNKNRYEVLKGKATSGRKLTPEEQAESNFLVNLGIGREGLVATDLNPDIEPDVDPDVTPDVVPVVTQKTYTATDGREFTDQQAFVDYEVSLRESTAQKNLIADQNKAERKSAYDLLFSEFKQYGLEALVTPLKSLIEEGVSPSEFTLRLRETDPYKKRFAANAQRVAKGLRAMSEAEYIGTEDQYQDVMRRYGMPETYYSKGELGVQTGFEKFLAGDVSAVELEDRIQTAQNRVLKSNPEVAKALKEFYPGISNGDILSYVLDPTNAIENIKRKVTAAEIGGAAIQSGLKTGMTRAEELVAAGITKAQAQQGFQTVAEVAPRGGQLAEIYKQDPYTQTTAEQEVFGLAGSVDAAKQRKKLTSLETAAFSGSAGMGAIARDRAGAI